jgi:hypothetical protein
MAYNLKMKYCIVILFISLLLPFVGCSDSATTTGGGSDIKGNLKGIVGAIDSNGVATERGGFRVELVGTSYSTVTDSTGYWEINNIPTRTYIIQYSKAGYQPYKSQFGFLGGSTVWLSDNNRPFNMRQPSKLKTVLDIISVGIDSASNQVVGLVSGHIFVKESTGTFFGTVTLFSKSPAVDITDSKTYLYSYISDYSGYYHRADSVPTTINIDMYMYPGRFPSVYFVPGDTIYCRMYAYLTTYSTIAYTGSVYASSGPDFFIDPETRAFMPLGTSEGSNILSAIAK